MLERPADARGDPPDAGDDPPERQPPGPADRRPARRDADRPGQDAAALGGRRLPPADRPGRPDLPQRGLRQATCGWTLDLAAAHRHVNADPARLQQVFWNLIKNAVKFTPEGGSIADPHPQRGRPAARTASSSRSADTGIGIEPEVLPTIFDPFQQGETTITRKFGGLGLGLAICQGIVEAHGGHDRRRERRARAGGRRSGSRSRPCPSRRSRATASRSAAPWTPGRPGPRRSASWSSRTSRRRCG